MKWTDITWCSTTSYLKTLQTAYVCTPDIYSQVNIQVSHCDTEGHCLNLDCRFNRKVWLNPVHTMPVRNPAGIENHYGLQTVDTILLRQTNSYG